MASQAEREAPGYFGVGVYHPKREVNVGTLWRTAYTYGAAFIFTVGRRYEHQASDTCHVPNHLPLYEFRTVAEMVEGLPADCPVVAVEQWGTGLGVFTHPPRAAYLLGAEDHGLPSDLLALCAHHVSIVTPKVISLNVAVAGSIVIHDRLVSLRRR